MYLAPVRGCASPSSIIETQLRSHGISDPAMIRAFRETPRDMFVKRGMRFQAYADCPVILDGEQVLPSAYDVARMIAPLELQGPETVFLLGSGSGYAAAVLCAMIVQVHVLEWRQGRAVAARGKLDALGCDRVKIRLGARDGACPDEERDAYDGVIVTASATTAPAALLERLKIGGRMTIAIGPVDGVQEINLFERTAADVWTRTELGPIALTPLLG